MPKPVARLIQILVVLALPVTFAVGAMRLTTLPWFVHWEYGKATFPPDPLGMTPAQRTDLALVAVDYLARSLPLSALGELTLPGGEVAFNARELQHMDDVQRVFDALTVAGAVALVAAVAGLLALAMRPATRPLAAGALWRGSLLALGLLFAVGAFMLLGWDTFFVAFHRVFFEGDSWLFRYTDTLIRLFPVRFWMDVGLAIVAQVGLYSVAVGALGWLWGRRLSAEQSG